MRKRTRKLVGAVIIIVFVVVYAMVALTILSGRLREASDLVQALSYAAAGILWILPLMPLIVWMERPDKD